jgi:hypothetical protein
MFAFLLQTQPAPVRDAFNYCLCVLMIQAGKMRLVEKVLGENGVVCVFETTVGDRFSVTLPVLSKEQEAVMNDGLVGWAEGKCCLIAVA